MKKGFVNIMIAISAIALGIGLSIKPWQVYAQQRRITDQQLAEMRRVERLHVQDLQREAKLGSAIGQEEQARRQGWRRKDETPDN